MGAVTRNNTRWMDIVCTHSPVSRHLGCFGTQALPPCTYLDALLCTCTFPCLLHVHRGVEQLSRVGKFWFTSSNGQTVFQRGCSLLSPITKVRAFSFPHSPSFYSCCPCGRWHLIPVAICFSLVTRVLSIFSCACWSFVSSGKRLFMSPVQFLDHFSYYTVVFVGKCKHKRIKCNLF